MFVWLASYPKSGNTWLRLLLDSLQSGGGLVNINRLSFGDQAASRVLFDEALGVASSDLTPSEVDIARPHAFSVEAQSSKKILFRKVHDAWRLTSGGTELFPRDLTKAALYVVRDPRDVVVSLAHHNGVTINEAIGIMANSNFTLASAEGNRLPRNLPQILSSWSNHVESWLDTSQLSPILLRYEDMLTDPEGCARKICNGLGWSVEEAVLSAAARQTRFGLLVEQENRDGFSERTAPGRMFFRSGKAGGWKGILTPFQAGHIEKNHGTVMGRMGYL